MNFLISKLYKTTFLKCGMYHIYVLILFIYLGFLFSFQCRFTLKYRHCDGKLVVKLTDDHMVCMIYFLVFCTIYSILYFV